MTHPARRSAWPPRFALFGALSFTGTFGVQISHADTISLLANADASVRLSSASGANSNNSNNNYGTE